MRVTNGRGPTGAILVVLGVLAATSSGAEPDGGPRAAEGAPDLAERLGERPGARLAPTRASTDAGPPLPARALDWRPLEARLKTSSRIARDAERVRALASPLAQDACCAGDARVFALAFSRFEETLAQASQVLHHPTPARTLERLEQELDFYALELTERGPRLVDAARHPTQRPAGPSFAPGLEAELACYRLKHLRTRCTRDAECTSLPAGCDAVATDQVHLAEASAWSEDCPGSLCPTSGAAREAVCRSGRCVVGPARAPPGELVRQRPPPMPPRAPAAPAPKQRPAPTTPGGD